VDGARENTTGTGRQEARQCGEAKLLNCAVDVWVPRRACLSGDMYCKDEHAKQLLLFCWAY
jgi:hypothetical protein